MEGGTMAAGDAQNQRCLLLDTDRLSELPDSVLLHILSFLHMRDAISAAGISRRWRHLWTATPCLDFCSYGADLSPDFIHTALMLGGRVKVRAFRAAVCTGPYQDVSDNRDRFIMRVRTWVHVALRRGVEELHLDCYDRDNAYHFFLQESPLPDILYTCKSLVSLWMRFGIMKPPSRISMTSLKSLTLCRSEIDPVVFGNVLAGCPILESLTLEECNTSGGLKVNAERANLKTLKISDVIYGQYPDSVYELLISAPSITTLAIQGYMRMPYHMNDLSSLVTASVDLRYMLHWEVERGNYECLRDLLRDLSHVRVLKLCSWCVQVLSVTAPESSWSSLDFNVMSLELVVGFIPREFPGIFLTLRSFTKLEYLAIDVCENRRIRFLGDIAEEYVDETTYVMPTERSSPNMLQHLKTVSISGLRGTLGAEAENETVQKIHEKCHNVFKFIQFLLENSPVLEKLTISCSENASKLTNKTFEVLFTLSSSLFALPRASPNALLPSLQSPVTDAERRVPQRPDHHLTSRPRNSDSPPIFLIFFASTGADLIQINQFCSELGRMAGGGGGTVVSPEGEPIPTSAVLTASWKHILVACRAENAAFINCKKKDPDPERCLDKGRRVTVCVLGLLKSLHQSCSKEMDTYAGCMYYHTNEFEMCRKEQEEFEKACPLSR